jgi:hypothetical protein
VTIEIGSPDGRRWSPVEALVDTGQNSGVDAEKTSPYLTNPSVRVLVGGAYRANVDTKRLGIPNGQPVSSVMWGKAERLA